MFRENDTTTIWLREHVREPLRSRPEVLLAVVLYRWFNRITTGEAIFQQMFARADNVTKNTAWDEFLLSGDTRWLQGAILAMCGKGPYVTGSYIIKTPDAMPKLDGVLWCIREFMRSSRRMPGVQGDLDWRQVAALPANACLSLEMMWSWLRQFPYLGDFMAYEIVTDLRYTDLLCHAPDIMTWANAGPGAIRGLNRIHDRKLDGSIPKRQSCEEMQELLALSFDSGNWAYRIFDDGPTGGRTNWPAWDMRTVEHTLCEFDKYERVRLGQGAPRQKFRSTR